MRPWYWFAPVLLAGCKSVWALSGESLDTDCEPVPYFEDADADGWGSGEPVIACEPDEESGFVARNGRDCVADDAAITGQIGSLCPANLTSGSVVIARDDDGAEQIAVIGGDETWPANAASACGESGWAGTALAADTDGAGELRGLVQPKDAAELSSLRDWLDAAGATGQWWVGAVVVDGEWVWADGSEISGASTLACGGELPAPDANHPGLALILRDGADGCLGYPDAVEGDTDGGAASDEAWMICERPTPNPDDYQDYRTE